MPLSAAQQQSRNRVKAGFQYARPNLSIGPAAIISVISVKWLTS